MSHTEESLGPRVEPRGRIDALNRFSLVLQYAACFFGYFVIEWMSRHSLGATVSFLHNSTTVFVYNTLLIFVSTLPVYLFRRRTFLRTLVATLWIALGAANGFLLSNRVTPLTGPDVANVSEAMGILGKYANFTERAGIAACCVGALALLALAFLKAPKFAGRIRRIPIVVAIATSLGGFYALTLGLLSTQQLSLYFSNIAYAYQDYGFPYCLTVTILDTGISEPNGYSQELMDGILDEIESAGEQTAPSATASEATPNIIIVQLESFFDPTRVSWLSFNQDPLPNWHGLSKGRSNGLYTVPTVGAGTVNTEFETLTGMSLRFFGAGEYPYKGVLREEACESLAFDLKALGYATTALHDNEANFYGRRVVYSYLGFDRFVSGEYMDTQDDVNYNGWMRDANLIPYVIGTMDATDSQDFVFAVSVQCHGSYPTESVYTEPAITVSGTSSDESACEWEYFCNQLHEEDQFVADLITAVEECGEPTVILFYGDHLPTMGLENEDMNDGSTTYETDYLIWDNLGLKERDGNLTSYQAAAQIMSYIGMHTGTLFRYHQAMEGDDSYLVNLQALQFDLLYGKNLVYGGLEPYQRTEIELGLHPLELESIEKLNDGIWYVHGDGFTQSARLVVNGEVANTTYLTDELLLVINTELDEGDLVNVAIQSNSSTRKILTSGDKYACVYAKSTDGTESQLQLVPAEKYEPAGEGGPPSEVGGPAPEGTIGVSDDPAPGASETGPQEADEGWDAEQA